MSKILKCILFAEDTTFFCSGENIEQMLEIMQTQVRKIQTWFHLSKLYLNLDKTISVVFSNRRKSCDAQLRINDTEIHRVSEIKYLGVFIHEKLT